MHPSSESFSFGTLKDIMLFFLFVCLFVFVFKILIYNNTTQKTKEQEKWDQERD